MSQNLNPINGGRSKVQVATNYKPGSFLSEQYVLVNKLQPSPTEWVSGGRPIYDRLPSASERYKLSFGLDDDSAYAYIPVGNPSAGPGTLQVQPSGDSNRFLTIQSGAIVWKGGRVEVDPVIVDLELMDMRSTRYLLAYQLYSDDSPFEAQYNVENYSLSGEEINIGSGTDVVTGWRYTPVYAFTNSDTQAWRNYDGFFPGYSGDAFLFWQTPYPCSYSKIKLRCPSNTSVTGTASLYYQTCPDSLQEGQYCQNPDWLLQYTTSVQRDSEGQFFEFTIPYPSSQYGWRVEWSDPRVSIKQVLVSGVVSLLRKPSTALTFCQLAAYPENAVPATIKNTQGQQVALTFCNLAYVDINSSYQITKIMDVRQTVGTNYQPIADWLTKPWDENLIHMYESLKNYPEFWINPPTCMLQEYASLEQYLVKVES